LAGSVEKANAQAFFRRSTLVPYNPSTRSKKLRPTGNLGANDIVILGTGDELCIKTITADAKAVRAAAQGVLFDVVLHPPISLTGR
jgi:hypothetical protein